MFMHYAFAIEIFMCIQGQHGKDITSQGLSGKIYPMGIKKLFGKATKKQSDKEFSIIPYHSACPCEYPGVTTFAPKKAVAGSIAVLLII